MDDAGSRQRLCFDLKAIAGTNSLLSKAMRILSIGAVMAEVVDETGSETMLRVGEQVIRPTPKVVLELGLHHSLRYFTLF